MKKSVIVACSVLAALALSAIGSLGAQTPEPLPGTPEDAVSRSFQFYPLDGNFGDYFTPTIAPGESIQLTANLSNTGDVPQDFITYRANASTAPGGGFQASAGNDEAPDEVTSWVGYPEEIVSLLPQQGVERSFTVSVPSSTRPGQYLTAIAAEQTEATEIEGTDVFTQKLRYVIPIFITVPGETKSGFDIANIALESAPTAVLILIELQNTGDVRVRPEGGVELQDSEGNLLASIPVAMQSIYAHDGTTLTLVAPGLRCDAGCSVSVNLTDAETGEEATAEATNVTVKAAATPAPPPRIAIISASVEPGPSADNVQFAVVDATIANTGEPVTNAQLSLLVFKDGDEVERFPISQSLALPQGDTSVNTRYIPLEGWSSGEWSFELLLETVDPNGAAVVVASQPIAETITVP